MPSDHETAREQRVEALARDIWHDFEGSPFVAMTTRDAESIRDINIAGALYRKINHGAATPDADASADNGGWPKFPGDPVRVTRRELGTPATPDADDERLDEFHNSVCIPSGGRCQCPDSAASTDASGALTEAEQKALGIRDGDCGCCFIVDSAGLREFVAARESAAATRARAEGAAAERERIAQAIEAAPSEPIDGPFLSVARAARIARSES